MTDELSEAYRTERAKWEKTALPKIKAYLAWAADKSPSEIRARSQERLERVAQMRLQGSTYAEIGEAEGVVRERARQLVAKAKRRGILAEWPEPTEIEREFNNAFLRRAKQRPPYFPHGQELKWKKLDTQGGHIWVWPVRPTR